jgi:hypothetical protein
MISANCIALFPGRQSLLFVEKWTFAQLPVPLQSQSLMNRSKLDVIARIRNYSLLLIILFSRMNHYGNHLNGNPPQIRILPPKRSETLQSWLIQ